MNTQRTVASCLLFSLPLTPLAALTAADTPQPTSDLSATDPSASAPWINTSAKGGATATQTFIKPPDSYAELHRQILAARNKKGGNATQKLGLSDIACRL